MLNIQNWIIFSASTVNQSNWVCATTSYNTKPDLGSNCTQPVIIDAACYTPIHMRTYIYGIFIQGRTTDAHSWWTHKLVYLICHAWCKSYFVGTSTKCHMCDKIVRWLCDKERKLVICYYALIQPNHIFINMF